MAWWRRGVVSRLWEEQNWAAASELERSPEQVLPAIRDEANREWRICEFGVVSVVTDAESPGAPQHALRLTFEYEGDEVRLVSQQRVAMLVPPADPAGDPDEQAGFWFEVRDREDRPIYRRSTQNPLRTHLEVFPPKDASFTHVEMPEPRGVFTLLVPDLEGARTLALVGSLPDRAEDFAAAQEIRRFDLTEVSGQESE
jgi:hypothetical protein